MGDFLILCRTCGLLFPADDEDGMAHAQAGHDLARVPCPPVDGEKLRRSVEDERAGRRGTPAAEVFRRLRERREG